MLFAPLLLATADDPTQGASGPQTIVFFSRADKRVLDETLLLDAVTIYTRDLGLSVVRVDDPSPSFLVPTPTDDAVAVLRARSARLGFWYQTTPDGRSLDLFTVDGRKQVTRQPFANDGTPGVDLYRAIALKIRVMVVGAEGPAPPPPPSPQPSAASPPANASPATSTGAATKGKATDRASGSPKTVAAVDERAAEPVAAAPASPVGLMLGAGYAVSAPSGSASWRHAGVLHAMASLHQPIEVDLGIELAPSDSQSAPTGTLSVLDLPVRVGLRLVRRGPSLLLGLGVITGAHLLFAHAVASDETSDRTWTASASAGLEFVARTRRESGVAPEFRLWVEGRAPRTRFWSKGTDPRFESGWVGVGASVGLTFSRP